MTITVNTDPGCEFEVKAKAAEVCAMLSDAPVSDRHFPKVERLVDMGGRVYCWAHGKSRHGALERPDHQPVVQGEFEKLVLPYIDNLIQRLEGQV